ncbi:MAG: protein phosphatase 2C domain-containing protein [Bacteroidales bacterium]|nr:protein phosphatase 2C domain-containing protein [Bacteroidales bacterium]
MNISIQSPLSFSEIGRKDNQEDYLWPDPNMATDRNRVFIMCDGIGGHDFGEVASSTAANALGTYITNNMPEDGVFTKEDFEKALSYTYDEIDKKDTGAENKMGTTMTCIVLHKGGVLVAHIGDSRIYHVRPSLASKGTGIIFQTADHSLVNELLNSGEITEEEAKNFPQKNVITRAIQPHLERRHKADIHNITDIENGDYFFLCSDGVLERVSNDILGSIICNETLSDKGKILKIKEVCAEGTYDNHTCWLIPIKNVVGEATTIVPTEESVIADTIDNEPVATIQPQAITYKEEAKVPKEAKRKTLQQAFFLVVLAIAVGITAFLLFGGKKDVEQAAAPTQTLTPKISEDRKSGGDALKRDGDKQNAKQVAAREQATQRATNPKAGITAPNKGATFQQHGKAGAPQVTPPQNPEENGKENTQPTDPKEKVKKLLKENESPKLSEPNNQQEI